MDEGNAAMRSAGRRANGCRSCRSRAGQGSSVIDFWDGELKTVRSPYKTDGSYEELVAMPALRLDAAFAHLNLGDKHGKCRLHRHRPVLRRLFLMAADRRYLSVEKVVSTRSW